MVSQFEILLLNLFSVLNGVSIDCPDVLNLALGLHLNTKQPTIWSSLQGDCCSGTGITCVNSRVDIITWISRGLDGTINGTALPGKLTIIYLQTNSITGPIPAQLPSTLFSLCLEGNMMTGDVPSLPSALQYLRLGWPGFPGNHFTGTVSLNQPKWLLLNYNWITELIVNDASLIVNTKCDLSDNPLLGSPNIGTLSMCTQSNLYSAALLPKTISTTSKITTTKTVSALQEPISTLILSTSIRSFSTLNPIKSTITSTAPWTLTNTIENTIPVSQTTLTVASTISSDMEVTNQMSSITCDESKEYSYISTINYGVLSTLIYTTIKERTTIPLNQIPSIFSFTLSMMSRICISVLTLGYVAVKTPFTRGLKGLSKKKQSTPSWNADF